MNSLPTVYQFHGAQVRVVNREDGPWFVAADVCRVLEIGNSTMATRRLHDAEKNTLSLIEGNRGNPNVTIVSESGLYKLIMRSDVCIRRRPRHGGSDVVAVVSDDVRPIFRTRIEDLDNAAFGFWSRARGQPAFG